MNISNELMTQIDRYRKTKSFAVNQVMKKEMSDLYKQHEWGTLNLSCGVCIRDAFNKIIREMDTPKPKINFIGVAQKKYEEMTYKEIQAEAKKKGIKANQSKSNLLKQLKNG
tara:strand:+ start:1234 stop:1569 length:336 start_codon:yes stop_codon:yes gene_type:complete